MEGQEGEASGIGRKISGICTLDVLDILTLLILWARAEDLGGVKFVSFSERSPSLPGIQST